MALAARKHQAVASKLLAAGPAVRPAPGPAPGTAATTATEPTATVAATDAVAATVTGNATAIGTSTGAATGPASGAAAATEADASIATAPPPPASAKVSSPQNADGMVQLAMKPLVLERTRNTDASNRGLATDVYPSYALGTVPVKNIAAACLATLGHCSCNEPRDHMPVALVTV
jgi:hypothetical protein